VGFHDDAGDAGDFAGRLAGAEDDLRETAAVLAIGIDAGESEIDEAHGTAAVTHGDDAADGRPGGPEAVAGGEASVTSATTGLRKKASAPRQGPRESGVARSCSRPPGRTRVVERSGGCARLHSLHHRLPAFGPPGRLHLTDDAGGYAKSEAPARILPTRDHRRSGRYLSKTPSFPEVLALGGVGREDDAHRDHLRDEKAVLLEKALSVLVQPIGG